MFKVATMQEDVCQECGCQMSKDTYMGVDGTGQWQQEFYVCENEMCGVEPDEEEND